MSDERKSVKLEAANEATELTYFIYFVSVVVWNPWIEKSKRMSNFGNEEFKNMICIEPGIIRGGCELQPGSTVSLCQSIEVRL